jgi:hypothetical protein
MQDSPLDLRLVREPCRSAVLPKRRLSDIEIDALNSSDHLVVRVIAAVLYPPGAAVGGPLDDKQLQQAQRLLSTIHRRVAGVQRTLDARHFRTLHLLGSARASMSDEVTPSQRGPEPIYAEIVGTTARIIDSAASQVLGRGQFYTDGPKRRENDTSDCSNWAPRSIALWWDPETRQVLALQTYRTGGCMCPDVPTETVQPLR